MGSIQHAKESFDFIVVGGGTAGNAVAGRLAENPNVSVLVIEAGPADPRSEPMITTPARAMELRRSKYDWGYKATMIDRPEYTRVEKPHTRGKVLGGCSCLNYYTWVRGSHGTYDDWAEFGGKDWDWNGCEEYFDKPANYHDDSKMYSPRLAKVGRKGPLDVAISDMVPELEPFRKALTEAWVDKGEKLTDNIYEGQVNGLVKCMNTIYKGVRSTSAVFLDGKPNITLWCETRCKQILIEDGKAVGLLLVDKDEQEFEVKAGKEIIMSCGVFETPKILMLSGIGPADQLKQFNIPIKVESKHVGQNLLDHPIFPHVFKLKEGYGLDSHLLREGPSKDAAVQAYAKNRKGPYHSGLLELVGFPRIDARLEADAEYVEAKAAFGGLDPFGPDGQPHFEIDFVPMFANAFQWHFPTPSSGDHLTVIVDLLRPVSPPGQVRLQSASYLDQANINLNFFASDLDLIAMREGVRFVDDIILNGKGMRDLLLLPPAEGPPSPISTPASSPNNNNTGSPADYPWPLPRSSSAAMHTQILERSQTGFHPCGTARLSQSIDQGVVDSKLRVHGVQGLRVIDASVFPVIPDSRIQNAVYMVAEKGADIVKGDWAEIYQL